MGGSEAGTAGSAGAGAGAGGGAGGAAGSGGDAPMAGSGGSAGACDCPAGQYCRAAQCLACSDLSSLEFGAPEPLLDHPSEPLRFPRPAAAASSLFYRLGPEGAGQIWFSPDAPATPGSFAGDPAAMQQSGAVYFGDTTTLSYNLFFDELAEGRRSARTASWDGQALTNVAPAMPPLSPGGFDDYDLAFALDARRTYWTSTRDGRVTLRTGLLGSGEADVVDLELPGPSGPCPRPAGDATPWVTPDGGLLLFRSVPMAENCQPSDGAATDLYAALLDVATGQPLVVAVPLSGVNVSAGGSSESDPSFSADWCTLYFASDRESDPGDFALYRAGRR